MASLAFIDRVNRVLDTQDVQNVATTLVSHQTEPEILSSTIPRPQAEQYAAEDRRRELQVSVGVCETLLQPSPLRQLPTEVMSEILCAYSKSLIPSQEEAEAIVLPYYSTEKLARLRTAQELPLRVCRQWYNIASATPRYWRIHILIVPTSHEGDVYRAQFWKYTEDRLGRARDTRLFVGLSLGQDPHSDVADIAKCMQLFRECAKQTQTLVLITPRFRPGSSRATSPETHLPHLRRLIVGPGDVFREPHINIQSLENLYSCSLAGPMAFGMASSTITHLHFRETNDFEDIREVILATPRLQHLWLSHVRNPDAVLPNLSHPNLLWLVLGSNPSSILHNCTFPKLHSLSLNEDTKQWPDDRDIAFFERSRCPIKYLTIMGKGGFSKTLPDVLYSLPALNTVNLSCMSKRSGNPLPSAFLEALAKQSRRQRPIPPHVTTFSFPEVRQMGRFLAALEGILANYEEYKLRRIEVEARICNEPRFKGLIDKLAEVGIILAPGKYAFPSYD
ncbi:hypothetical protein CYLTODRAFT_427507 [Cylindrobasidium torrendii FP15055 ss-10]|uniref:Uncharacterized protein n=1 Tax=Cylindrobasidium torrendii FP15055 ss-10 TaxID=1314674 RepID=A0A0D7AUH9_9AGAR|nr:hypothetical protein CYLTODRAFT_427507 [Cylindrobasidium torrendii FP15055 ss-10]